MTAGAVDAAAGLTGEVFGIVELAGREPLVLVEDDPLRVVAAIADVNESTGA